MEPYLVDSVTNYKGVIIDENKPEKYKDLMTSGEAAELKDYMTSVVEYGTASVLSGQSYTAAGKTGTAEYSSDKEEGPFVVCRYVECRQSGSGNQCDH